MASVFKDVLFRIGTTGSKESANAFNTMAVKIGLAAGAAYGLVKAYGLIIKKSGELKMYLEV